MSPSSIWLSLRPRVAALLLLATLSGCKRESIQVYEVPKEKLPERPEMAGVTPPMPELRWTKLPDGWESRAVPNRMRAANFVISGAEGKAAELSVIPLAGMGGNDLEFVNMWRKQIGLESVTAEVLPKYMAPVKIAGLEAKLFDMRGSEAAQASDPNGVLVAVVVREGVTWFFKLAGDEALVQKQRPVLIDFLKDVTFAEPDPSARMAATSPGDAPEPDASPGGGPALPSWTLPAGWSSVAPGSFVLKRFVATGDGGARTDVTVSYFAGDGGGLLANLNRWREQLGLTPLSAETLAEGTSALTWQGAQGTSVDMQGNDRKTGRPARVVGVVVPVSGGTWFYKMMGDPAVTEREKGAFLKFVQSTKYGQAL